LIYGYVFFLIIAFSLLSLPIAQNSPIEWLDTLFIATSAVSTTGLITAQPGVDYSFFGQLVLLLIIQIGGIGYMTFGSFILVALKAKMSKDSLKTSLEMSKREFAFPKDFKPSTFVKKVVLFTLIVECIGAVLLAIIFTQNGEAAPIWSAIFHSVSAFCTAGFSLMTTSFQSYQGHLAVNIIISVLSLLGAIGFIVMVDVWDVVKNPKNTPQFSTTIILKITFTLLVGGTLFVGFTDDSLNHLPTFERWMTVFFQVMTASTTVGFNTFNVANMHIASVFVMFFLMLFGASPSGTGGGLKSTTLAALIAIVRSTLKRRKLVSFDGKRLPLHKLQLAASSFILAFAISFIAVTILLITEEAPLSWILFEVLSAIGTVGLTMGLTTELSDIGKLVIMLMMFMGRVGILTFGVFLSLREENEDEDNQEEEELVL
jgi:trk system potassium uptake protein TrkH